MKSFAYEIEEIEAPVTSYTETGVQVMRTFLVSFDNVDDFVQKMLGNGVGQQTTILPDTLSTSYLNMEAVEAEVTGFLGDNAILTKVTTTTAYPTMSGKALVKVKYLPKDRTQDTLNGDRVGDGALENSANPGGDPIIIDYKLQLSSEVMLLQGAQVKGKDDGKKLKHGETFAYFIAINRHQITMYDVPNLPLGPIKTTRGKINDGSFTIPVINITLADERGLFLGADVSRRYTAANFRNRQEPAWTVSYEFIEKLLPGGNGWNHILDSRGNWKKIVLGNGDDAYEAASFGPLFFM